MESLQICPECGVSWQNGNTCLDQFHQLLFWEAEFPDYGVVHHLMVLCYHLQHPSLYSPEGLREAKWLLVKFLEHGTTPAEVRQRIRDRVNSSQRAWTITSRPDSHGSYAHPVSWTMTAASVVAGGAENYVDNVRAWAQSVYESLKSSENL